jgi:hypothetical protein
MLPIVWLLLPTWKYVTLKYTKVHNFTLLLYMCETKYLPLMEEHRLNVSEKTVPFFSCFKIHMSTILPQCSSCSLACFPFVWHHHAACMPVHPLFNFRIDWFSLNLVLALSEPMRCKIQCRKLQHEEHHNFPSLKILQLLSIRRWDGWSMHHAWRMKYVCNIFDEKLGEKKEPFGKPWHR